jgi:PASTA domain
VITLEDRLREYYHDEVAGLEVADLLPGVLATGRRVRRHARALWAGTLAAAAVVLVGSLTGLSLRAHVRPALGPPGSRPFTVVTRTDLEGWGPPTAMAAVPGGVWLASWDEGGLLRVDAATGRITARVPVGLPQHGPYSIAYGAGSLWVTDFRTGDLLRLNPVSGRLVAKVSLGAPSYVTVGGTSVWATVFGHVRGAYWNRLVKIDPATDRIVGDLPVAGDYGPGGMMVAAAAAVWLHIDGGPFVQAAEPARLVVTARTQTGDVQGLTAIGRQAFVLTNGWALDRIGPPWLAVSRSVQLPPYGSNLGGDIAAGPGQTLWVGGQALYQVSAASMRVRAFSDFGAYVDDVAVFGTTIWVQAGDGIVYQAALHSVSSVVPDVVMLPLAAAERLLTRDGYTVKVTREPGLEPLGLVIYQNPAAESRVPAGTRVTLIISAGPVTQTGSP